MTKKRRLVAGALGVVVALAGIWLFTTRPAAEPRYQGKTVTEWLTESKDSSPELANNPAIRGMLLAVGSDAVPVLLNHLRSGDSLRNRVYLHILDSQSAPSRIGAYLHKKLIGPYEMTQRAGSAMRFLGTNASGAIPELERMAVSNRRSWGGQQAIKVLAGLDVEGWKAIGRVLSSLPPADSLPIRHRLAGTSMQALTNENLQIRQEAAHVLSDSGSAPFEIVPVLVEALDSNDRMAQVRALHTLGKLAPVFRTAADTVRRAAQSDDSEIRMLAQSILKQSAPTNTVAQR